MTGRRAQKPRFPAQGVANVDAGVVLESTLYVSLVIREARPPATGSECATGDGISTTDEEEEEATTGSAVSRERSRGGGVVDVSLPASSAGEVGRYGWQDA